MISKGGDASGAGTATEDEELEVLGAATSIAEGSGVAAGTDLIASAVDATTGGPLAPGPKLAPGRNLQPAIRVCPGVAVPLCSPPCLHRMQVQ